MMPVGSELGDRQKWANRLTNRPRVLPLVRWRAAVEAVQGLERIERCSKDGRPMELNRSLFTLGAVHRLTADDLERLQKIARERGHQSCVEVLEGALLKKPVEGEK